jgi:hypothetical protein
LDSSGNVFVTGTVSDGTNSVDTTVAYSNSGVPLWTKPIQPGAVPALRWTGSGNVFVTGCVGPSAGEDFITIKYSSSLASGPRLNFQLLNDQLVLSWTNAGYFLQTTPAMPGMSRSFPAQQVPTRILSSRRNNSSGYSWIECRTRPALSSYNGGLLTPGCTP